MKLDQEQIKKLSLGVLMLAALLYGYFAFLLGPLQQSQKSAIDGIAAIIPQIADAKKQISKTAELEIKAPQATGFLTQLKNTIPDGAPIAWFPPKMAGFFKSHGIEKCTTHLVSEAPDSMPGFRRLVWSIDVPKVEYVPLGVAISSLENDEPLLTILNVAIDTLPGDAEYQHAVLTLATLVKS